MRDHFNNDLLTRIDSTDDYVDNATPTYEGHTVTDYVEAVESELCQGGDAGVNIACAMHSNDVPLDSVGDALGCYDETPEEQAEEFMQECMEIPENLQGYIDYEQFAFDCAIGGDLSWYLIEGTYVAIRGNL